MNFAAAHLSITYGCTRSTILATALLTRGYWPKNRVFTSPVLDSLLTSARLRPDRMTKEKALPRKVPAGLFSFVGACELISGTKPLQLQLFAGLHDQTNSDADLVGCQAPGTVTPPTETPAMCSGVQSNR